MGCVCTARLGLQRALEGALLAFQLRPLAIQCSVLRLQALVLGLQQICGSDNTDLVYIVLGKQDQVSYAHKLLVPANPLS